MITLIDSICVLSYLHYNSRWIANTFIGQMRHRCTSIIRILYEFHGLLFSFYSSLSIIIIDNELYSGTVADFSGSDPIIYREPLQTEQYDSLSLNGKFYIQIIEIKNYQIEKRIRFSL